LVPWLANLPLHHDEALYGAWARSIADGSDPLLLIPWVDKPPLVLYLLAASLKLFGPSELALRAPGMIAAALTVWATYGLARRIYGPRVALLAAALFALSPFAILFGPTAFTDPWVTLFLVAASWAALARHPAWAGALAALAAASKQQGVFAIPLVVALIVLAALTAQRPSRSHPTAAERPPRSNPATVAAALALAVLGFAIVFGLVTWWDSLRWHNRPSYWDQSLRAYGGVVLAALADWPARIRAWSGQLALLFGAAWLTAPVLIAAFLGARAGGAGCARCAGGRNLPRLAIAAYILAYLLVHIAFTFQPWDRYLLPILPLICVLAARGMVLCWRALLAAPAPRTIRRAALAAANVTAVTLALYAAGLGVTASIPAGSDVGAYSGVAQAARFLAGQPQPSTVYHDRLGWHLEYYLYGLPVARSWYDSPQKLASEAARIAREQPGSSQWLALPAWEESELPALTRALAARGFRATPGVEVRTPDGARVDLTLYRLVPAFGAEVARLRGNAAP
jgi:hypothetical protein